ncbi:MAG: hypothetical protein ACREJ3_12715 [Polyangiaceae bacterium]
MIVYHLTDRMKDHYSTVDQHEQRDGIGRVLARVKAEGIEIVKTRATDEQQANEQPPRDPEPADG